MKTVRFGFVFFSIVSSMVLLVPWLSSYIVKYICFFIFLLMMYKFVSRLAVTNSNWLDWLFLSFLCLAFLGVLKTYDAETFFSFVLSYFGIYFIYFVVTRSCDSPSRWLTLGYFYIGSCILVSALIFVNWILGSSVEAGVDRFSIGEINANYIAYTLATAVAVAFSIAVTIGRPFVGPAWVGWLSIFLIIFSVFLTGCRGAILGIICSSILYIIRISFLNKMHGAIVLGVACISVFVFFQIIPVELQERLVMSDIRDIDSLSSGRVSQYDFALDMISSNFLLGSGAGSFFNGEDENMQLHSVFLNVTLEHGVVGLLFYLSIIFMCVSDFFKIEFNRKRMWAGGFVLFVWIPIAATGVWAYSAPAWFAFSWVSASIEG